MDQNKVLFSRSRRSLHLTLVFQAESNFLDFNTLNQISAQVNFRKLVESTDWSDPLKLKFCQESFTTINNKINELYLKSFPLKPCKKNKACNPLNPWMSSGLLESRKTKENINGNFQEKSKEDFKENFKDYFNVNFRRQL